MKVLDHLERNGCRGRIVSVRHVEELRGEARSHLRTGQLDKEFYEEWMPKYIDCRPPRDLAKAKSIIVVAYPSPALRTKFRWNGKDHHFIIPPTYADYYRVTGEVRRLLKEGLRPRSYRLTKAVLPLKLLAVRSGLSMYGRNNITYVPGFGSFNRLAAFYSDFESPEDHWQEMQLLPKCSSCKACLKGCPTGAICEDRILLRAERCLTRLNERDVSKPFPEWLDSDAHNALVGCMHCQRVCPYDKEVKDWHEDRGIFTEEETAYLLRGKYTGTKAKAMEKKLKSLGIDLTIFPRNLEVLLPQR